jgi:crossover junction endodeoxyribonuclease RuvC
VKILGIDPSLRSTGYGLIEAAGNNYSPIAHGEIKNPPAVLPSRCLVKIHDTVTGLIDQHHPEVMAIEGLVYVQNTRIAFTLGQVRGVIIAAAAKAGMEIYEYAPRKVKQSVTGQGGAGKSQVANMIKAQLGLPAAPTSDAADALAIALCHAHNLRSLSLSSSKPI